MIISIEMKRVENPQEFRSNIRKELFKIFNEERICENVERGVYNYCIQQASKRNIVKKWDNVYFCHIYIDRLRSVFINLKDDKLVESILTKKMKAHEIGFITHQEMQPEKWQKFIEAKKLRDKNLYSPKVDGNTDNFTCRKCKSKNCSYYQLQTRSADEPMTTFVTCIDCGNRWKC